MIQEYAIDPESLVTWARDRLACRHIKDNFGIGTPRIMSDFPKLKNWRKQLRIAATSLDDTSRSNLEELFKLLIEKTVTRSGCEYDGNDLWIDNVEKENKRHLFKAILATDNPNNNEQVLLSDEVGDWPAKLWDAPDRLTAKRDMLSMTNILRPLLQKSTEILFVDPFFRADEYRFREPVCAFLRESINCSIYPTKQRVEIHVSADYRNSPPADYFKKECLAKLPQKIPKNLELKIRRWKQKPDREKLHNRYILTELGGVSFGIGLDSGQKGETDEVNLLSRDQWWLRWNQYGKDTREFELDIEFLVKCE